MHEERRICTIDNPIVLACFHVLQHKSELPCHDFSDSILLRKSTLASHNGKCRSRSAGVVPLSDLALPSSSPGSTRHDLTSVLIAAVILRGYSVISSSYPTLERPASPLRPHETRISNDQRLSNNYRLHSSRPCESRSDIRHNTTSMAGSAASGLLGRQLKQMQSDKDIPGISCGLVKDNIFEWEVMLMISDDCKFYGGTAGML